VVLVVLLLASSLLAGPGSVPAMRSASAPTPSIAGSGLSHPNAAASLAEAQGSLASGAAPFDRSSEAWGVGPLGPARAPGPTAVSLVWDASDGYVLAVAPDITGNYTSTITNLSSPSQTWKFLGGTWTELHPANAPSSRGFAAMTYDAKDGYVLLFGGVPTYGFCAPYEVTNHPGQPFYNCYNDTWKYLGGSWTNLTAHVGPAPPRYFDGTTGYQTGPQLVYDGADQYALLYGENNSATWGYSGGHWVNLTATAGTPPGGSGSMAYDASDGYVLYFGGDPSGWSGSPFACTSQTWEFAHGVWADVSDPLAIQPSPRSFASMAFDAAIGRVLLFGGVCQSSGVFQNFFETWSYYGGPFGTLGQWNELSSRAGPTPRFAAALVFDPTDNETVLFGGAFANTVTDSVTTYRDTWVLGAESWSSAGPLLSSPRTSLDRGTNLTLSVVGLPFDALSTGLFLYTGLPPGCVGVNAPELTCMPQIAGSFQVNLTISSGLGSANATLRLIVNPDPSVRSIDLSRHWTEPGVPVEIATTVDGGTGPFSYAYTSLPGCSAANAASFSCDPTTVGTFTIGATATDAQGLQSNLSETLYVVPDLAVAPVRLSPGATDVGFVAVAVVGLTGGLGPYSVAYRGLPPGCASSNTTSLACRPTAAGDYALSVLASDSVGFAANASATLVVNPDPTVSAFTVSQVEATVGQAVTFQLQLAGGTGPFSVTYGGLPGGCASSNTTHLSCTPSVTGTFAVVATATDAVGATVAQPVTLIVSNPSNGNPGGSGLAWLGPFGSSAFAQGVLAGLLVLLVVGLSGGWAAVASARDAEARRLADEMLERAEELSSEVEDPNADGAPTAPVGPR
jgi:hypothetical protein